VSAVLGRRLTREFYDRPVLAVARDCVGKVLVKRSADGVAAGRIVECEAYRGPEDLAAHSSRGRTKRTEAMFGPPGHAYVFLIYGTSWAFNLVVAAEGKPQAVLVRALEPVLGLRLMAKRRGVPADSVLLTNGPGKLCQALGITGDDYAGDLCRGDLFVASADGPRPKIARSPRINVDYAGAWARKPWRFFEAGNAYVSVAPRA
jgi:DNA-3-methyladenine glycosylase